MCRAAGHHHFHNQGSSAHFFDNVQADAGHGFIAGHHPVQLFAADDHRVGIEHPGHGFNTGQDGVLALERLAITKALAGLNEKRKRIDRGFVNVRVQRGRNRDPGCLIQTFQGRLGQF